MAEPAQVFLSHTHADKSVVNRFFEGMRQFSDIRPWIDENELQAGDDLLESLTRAISMSSHVVVFWSKNAFSKYESRRGVGDLSWIALEIRTAIQVLLRINKKIILVRLDDSGFPDELVALFSWRLSVDAIGSTDHSRSDRDRILWRATNSIIGSVRGRNPIYPATKLLPNRNGNPKKKSGYYYFEHSWIGGHDGQKSGVHYIDGLDVYHKQEHRGTVVPAVKYADGSFGFRFSIPNHTSTGWWSVAISFGLGNVGWRTVNLRNHGEMHFTARASDAGAPLSVSFTDNHQGSKSRSGHQETSRQIFRLGSIWRAGSPWILNLNELDWSINGFPDNTQAVNREEVLQIVFNNGGERWEPGIRWIEVKDIVIL
jgi:TIR domain